jgi:hypothetical protein
MEAAAERKARLRALREAAGAAYPSAPAEEAPSEPLATAPEDECALALLTHAPPSCYPLSWHESTLHPFLYALGIADTALPPHPVDPRDLPLRECSSRRSVRDGNRW